MKIQAGLWLSLPKNQKLGMLQALKNVQERWRKEREQAQAE
jgi:hypothetical protein